MSNARNLVTSEMAGNEAPYLRAVADSECVPAHVSAPTDDEIVAALRRRERWAARALYDECHGIVERTLLRVLRSHDADLGDLLQVCFERLLRTVSRKRFTGAVSLKAWASSTAVHVALDELRRRRRRSHMLHGDYDSLSLVAAADVLPASAVERQLEARADATRVQGILMRMKPEQAEAVVLHDVLGHELVEVAALQGVSITAAQSRLVRGRRELLRRARAVLPAKEQKA